MNILIIGYGQIGKSIEGVYEGRNEFTIFHRDLEEFPTETLNKLSLEGVDTMHICYGYYKDFVKDTLNNIERYKPNLTIINSTVPVGTTATVFKASKANIVHSPVMGKHPNLTESIKTFKKIVGANSDVSKEIAVNHFKNLNIETETYDSSDDSEAAKLLDTTYYGWNILYMKYVHRFCEENNLNFENVYTKTNKIYNEGYTKMGDRQFVRPVLKYIPGPIGGHCVIPNMNILKEKFKPAKLGLEMEEETK